MWVDFNVNSYVRVKLTDVGRQHLRQWHKELFSHYPPGKYEYTPPDEDVDGYTRFQLWELMAQLGSKCMNGGPVPFWTTIKLELPDTRRAKS
jgi:hypothetical protein